MSKPPLQNVVRTLFKLAGRPDGAASDQELLTRYVEQHDETAFELLVRRHGPMVHDLCRRLLGQEADADDASQAVFLVLVRKARSIRKKQSLASWLYGVAYRVAERAKRDAAAERKLERRPPSVQTPADPGTEAAWSDLCATLDAELAKLSDTYRAPLVLCYLEGQTRDHAARHLGLAVRTLDRRLERGRGLLRSRLERRGVMLSSALLIGGLSQRATAAGVAEKLLSIAAARQGMDAAAIPLRVQLLANGVLKSMAVAKLQTVAALVLGFGMAIAGTGALVLRAADSADGKGEQDAKPASTPNQTAQPKPAKVEPPRTDQFGDPLPPGAVNRLGSSRFRHGGQVTQVIYTPDASAMASTSSEGFLRLWDAKTGKLRWRLAIDPISENNLEHALAVSPDGKTLAVLNDFEFAFVATDSGKRSARWSWVRKTEDEAVRSLAVSPDLQTLARGCWDATVRLYDTGTGQEKVRITVGDKAKSQIPMKISFSGDGKTLCVMVNRSQEVKFYEGTSGKLIHSLKAAQGSGFRMAFSHDGRLLVTTSFNPNRMVLWDLKSGKEMRSLDRTALCADFSRDNKVVAIGSLAIGSQRGEMILLNANTGEDLRRLHWQPTQTAIKFSPDGKTLAAGDSSGCVTLWEVATGKLLPASPRPSGSMYDLRFEAAGDHLLSISDSIDWWDVKTGELLRHVPRDPESHWCAAVSPNGKLLATSVGKGDIALVDIDTRQRLRTFSEHTYYVFRAVFSPDGSKLFSAGGADTRLIIWDVATARPLQILESHTKLLGIVVVSPDGRWLAASDGSGDFDIRLWEVATGRLVHRLPPRRGSAMAMAFSPDSSQLASVGGDPGRANDSGEVHLWDVTTGKEVRSMAAHKERVVCVTWSPDGRTLATGGLDRTLYLWEVASGLERRRILGHEGYVNSVAFSPDGKLLAAASDDAPVYVWDVYGSETSRPAPGKLGKEESDKLWQQLAATDAAKGFEAVCALVARPDEAVSLLEAGWRRSPRATRQQMESWLKDLDSEQFAVRQKATAELAKFTAGHEDSLRQAREKAESLETRRRLDQLLNRLHPERLRRLRMVEVLERIDTSPARQLLQTLAGQTEDATLMRDAAASMRRLGPR